MPPAKTWKRGEAYLPGAANQKIPVNTVIVPIIPAGIRQSMAFLYSRKAAPISKARADVSPNEPPVFPKNRSFMEASVPLVTASWNFRAPRGVAKVAVFIFCAAVGIQVVIATGKAVCKKALPTRAGLKMLFPSPPKTCFPRAMAMTAPIAAESRGRFGGRIMASKRAVMTADPSQRECIGFFLSHRKTASVARAAIRHVR